MAKASELVKPNIVLIITDQQTWKQKWDTVWAEKHLPAMNRLLKKGLAFNNAICNSCTCTASRATLFTSTFPATHGATQVLAFDDPFNKANPSNGYTQVMQGQLRNNMGNMFKMMEDAGYNVAFKGKWHVSKPVNFVKKKRKGPLTPDMDHLYWTEDDETQLDTNYGIKEWNFPDAGDDANIYNFGGGRFNNDGRFVDGEGQSAWYGKKLPRKSKKQTEKEKIEASAVNFINNYGKGEDDDGKPLFMVVSLVNPHDVLSYPGNETMSSPYGVPRNPPLYRLGGYKKKHFMHIPVELPSTWNEKLKTKPKIQSTWQGMVQGFGEINSKKVAHNYVKFYAHLTSVVDKEIVKVLDAIDDNPRTKDSIIVRISDHGDMAMSHGMMRQKMFNAYQQTINVPMIFSHTTDSEMFAGQTTESFAGLIDIMPTLADFAGANTDKYPMQGQSLMDILDKPEKTVQDHLHFTFDDSYIESAEPQEMGACRIRTIIQEKGNQTWKYSVYFDPNYNQNMEYEMYNLTNDPDERHNLAYQDLRSIIQLYNGTTEDKLNAAMIKKKRQELHELLTEVMWEKGTMPDTVIWPEVSGEENHKLLKRLKDRRTNG
ncbi:MAG: sulfatase-like hydrolase/transferase [Crocinitomicaceae bacterium]|nr:sulfatase-like hydrolase/transferase [Crocinitomicaceae bacterium]